MDAAYSPIVYGGPEILQMSKLCTCQAEAYLMANGLVEQYGIRRIRGRIIVECGCPKGDGVLDLHIYLQGTAWISAHAMQQVGREDKGWPLPGGILALTEPEAPCVLLICGDACEQ